LSRSKSPPRGGIWHPSVMQFYSGPLMHFLSGVDTGHNLLKQGPILPLIFRHFSHWGFFGLPAQSRQQG
jgi:hypothetical protein